MTTTIKIVKGRVKVPRCWKRLIGTVFERSDNGYVVAETVHPVTSEQNQKGDDDPEPHYDDSRFVLGSTEDGGIIELDLASGQGNYYGGVVIHNGKGEVIYDEDLGDPMENLDDEQEFVGEDGNTYLIAIQWEGSDPYEHGYPTP